MSLSEENADRIRKLLACKRYEQPRPGYFHFFSDQVISRLEAGEQAGYSSWREWLIQKFDAKPILACAYGVAVSGLLLTGFGLAQIYQTESGGTPNLGGTWMANSPGASPFQVHGISRPLHLESSIFYSASETSAWPEMRPSLFKINALSTRPASFGAIGY